MSMHALELQKHEHKYMCFANNYVINEERNKDEEFAREEGLRLFDGDDVAAGYVCQRITDDSACTGQ